MRKPRDKAFDPRTALRTVRVGPFDYRVRWVDAPRDMVNCVGQVKHELHEIDILCNGTPQYVADTLLHEVLHAVFDTSGLKVQPPFDEEKVEERTVSALATGLVQIIRDNPNFVITLVRLINGARL